MSDKSSTNSIDQFVNAARNITDPVQATELIIKAVESPQVYSFSELLEVPVIASLQGQPQFAPFYDLLRLYSYGTYLDYKSNKERFPSLSANAVVKLRHLSIVTLAGKGRTIPYNVLCQELDIGNVRELEDLIIEAFYADIIKGKLDQFNNQLEIDFAIGRDVTDEQVDEILLVLDDWCKNCNIALKTIETQISNANAYKQKQIDIQANIEAEVLNLKKSLKLQSQEVESLNNSSAKDSGKRSMKMKTARGGSTSGTTSGAAKSSSTAK